MNYNRQSIDAALQAAEEEARQQPSQQPPGPRQGPPQAEKNAQQHTGRDPRIAAALRDGQMTPRDLEHMGINPRLYGIENNGNRPDNRGGDYRNNGQQGGNTPVSSREQRREVVPPPVPQPQVSSKSSGKKEVAKISGAREKFRTDVRRALIKVFGSFCTLVSLITTIYCFCRIEELWRGVPGSWTWHGGVLLGAIAGVFLFLTQLALSDWDSPGVFIGYWVALGLDMVMTFIPTRDLILFPIFFNSSGDVQAASLVSLGIGGVWSFLSAKASEWAHLGRPAKTLLDRLMGRG